MKVRIKKLGKLKQAAYGGQQPDGALDVTPTSFGGSMASAQEGVQVQKTLTREPREEANLEAEGGETAFGPISGDTIPDHMVIKGPRHSSGGVPLNLPDDTFIFSDTRKMKITDPSVLAMFGKKKKKGGYTPADLAKPYDIQKYKAILMDPESDDKAVSTAQMMIQNYVLKLGALALAQEAKKGFPQGIPEMARPYMEANGIADEDLLPEQPEQEQPQQPMQPMPEQPMEQMPEMEMQPPMAFGGYSDLNRFIEGGDPTLAFNNGTVQGATAMDRLDNAIYSEENLDNLTMDDLNKRNEELLAENVLEEEELDLPPTPEEIASGEDPEGGKASYKWKNKFNVNKPELARRANMAMKIGANLINEYDRRRIAGRSKRASFDEPARQKDSRGMYGANTGREALRNMEEAEMIVGQDYGQYGGSMMDYAMSMGGSYFPTMATGGFNMLPMAENGDGGKTRKKTKEELAKKLPDATVNDVTEIPDDYILVGKDDKGNDIYGSGNKTVKVVSKDPLKKREKSSNLAKDEGAYIKSLCNSLGPGGAYDGHTAQSLADASIISQSAVAGLQPCENLATGGEEDLDDDTFVRALKEVELCQCTDENGEPLEPQPEPDPETGKCPCPTYDETTGEEIIVEEEPYIDDPHWSDVATRGVYTAAMMDPGVERPQLALPDRVETRPVYEDYLAKVQAIQAGLTTAADSVNKTAGSTSDKMAMLSQLVGQASPAAANAVAETQARNIGYQDAANARQLQADANYANAVADVRGRQSMLDADAANTYRTNRNVKAANVQEQVQQAENEMVKRQQMNTMYPQYAAEYHKGFITPTGRGRTPVPEKPVGIEDYAAMLAQAKGAFQDDELARKYVEAQMGIKGQYGGQYAKGGYVMGSNVFPFMFY
tara:strand:+ start:10268 stop:12934 length:2667 start_codon:yes stop_codon:yes gene_type:complete